MTVECPIVFKHKTIEYQNLDINKLIIQMYPTNLPSVDEFMRLQQEGKQISTPLPVISNVFDVKFSGNNKQCSQLIVDAKELYKSHDYSPANLSIKFALNFQLKQHLLKIMSSESQLRLPLHVEQRFELSIATYQSNYAAQATFPVLVKAQVDLSQEIQRVVPPSTRNVRVDNHLLGLNLQQVNGFADQLFTD